MTKARHALVVAAELLAATTTAQTEEALPDMPLAEKCRAEPRNPTQPPAGAPSGEDAIPAPDSLTDTLEPCAGVLAPPETGDDDMTEPPPPEGRTPVIRPGDIPEEQPPVR